MGLFLLTTAMNAQQIPGPPPVRNMPDSLPMQSILYDLDQMVTKRQISSQERTEWFRRKGLVSQKDGQINIEIINQVERVQFRKRLLPDSMASLGRHGEIEGKYLDYARSTFKFSPGFTTGVLYGKSLKYRCLMMKDQTVTGSDDYRDNGADGSGINIGIIDGGYTGLTAAINAGNAPVNYTEVNYAGDTFESGGDHGTRCVENVFDHAPGADYFIYKIVNLTDLGAAVDHAVANNARCAVAFHKLV